MEDNNKNLSSSETDASIVGGPWWKPAMQVFSEISTWIAMPVILAVIFGGHLDSKYNTKPTMFLISVVIAFLVSSYGIIRTVKRYTAKIRKNQKL